MNLRALMDRKNLNKNLVVVLLLTFLPTGFGPLPEANAVNASSLTSNSLEARCASTASDTSSAKLDVIIDGNYCVLRFLSSTNTWTPPSDISRVDFLAIGGGGAGGWGRGGGGGAGGFLESYTSISQTSYAISVGTGGVATTSTAPNGDPTSFGSVTVGGGGGAGGHTTETPTALSVVNGSGGGSGMNYGLRKPPQALTSKTIADVFASNGATPECARVGSSFPCADPTRNTGGGGGASHDGYFGAGGDNKGGYASTTASDTRMAAARPDGGEGKSSKITGSAIDYAGGGGGAVAIHAGEYAGLSGTYYSAPYGHGKAGGGDGAYPTSNSNVVLPGSGRPNSGSGGGGGGDGGLGSGVTNAGYAAQKGGDGGSGVVILRFLAPNFNNDYSACNTGFSPTSSYIESRSVTYVAGDCLITLGAKDEYTQTSYSWQVPQGVTSIKVVLVGGGGGGGNNAGGGGGGGQVVDSTTVPIRVNPSETYTLTVGIGGAKKSGYRRETGSQTGGTAGGSSSIVGPNLSLTALGGGGAAGSNFADDSFVDNTYWTSGGCGAYNTCNASSSLNPVGGAQAKGGNGYAAQVGSGGGGAGGAGGNANPTYASSNLVGGNGGVGKIVYIAGSAQCFGGGGGGGAGSDATARSSASCGGGQGNAGAIASQINAGTAATGGGGGGAGMENATNGGHGGSGVIIIRFTVPNPRGATQSLNMACHGFSSSTTTEQSRSAGYFGTAFTTDSTTSEFTFESLGYNSMFGHEWGAGGPTGCGTSGDYYTVYAWGYLQNPTGTQQNIYFEKQADDGFRLVVDGKVFFDEDTQYTTVSNNATFISMKPGSWHFIQLWKHEVINSSSLGIRYKTSSGGSLSVISSSYLSRYVPRSITSSTIPISTRYNETLTVSMTVDTSTEVIGGINDSSTVMSMKGRFTFYDSQTALSGCVNVYSSNGAFKCSWYVRPSAIGYREIKVVFTPDTSTAMTDLQYNVFRRVEWTQTIEVTKGRQSPLRIGQYTAFIGISSYPLNVYPDTSIYPKVGTTYTRSVTTGTAGCQLDPTRFFVTDTLPDTSTGGSCVATVVLSGTELFAPETGTATIYFVRWSDAYATQVPSGAHTIPLSGGTQIIVHTETVTVTDTATAFRDLINNVITSAAPGDEIRIYITGYAGLTAADLSVTFRVYEDATITAKTDTYVQVLVPSTASSGVVAIDSPRGVSYTPSLTISP